MNILPKKSWHVRSYKNIERVKRDEAQAAEESKKKQERASLAEQEARTALLRNKAHHHLTSADDPDEHQLASGSSHDDRLAVQTSVNLQAQHVDLFSDLSTEKQKGEKNKEHEKEEKAAKEKYEQKIGLLTYLGQSSAEAQTTKPWYFKPPDRGTAESQEQSPSCKDVKRKASLDPMRQMEKYLGVKKSKGDATAPMTKTTLADKTRTSFQVGVNMDTKSTSKYQEMLKNTTPDGKTSTHQSHKSKHKHKHKRNKDKLERSKERSVKHNKKKGRHGELSLERRKEPDGPSIQQLREERLRREAAERVKTNRLLSGEKLEGGAKRGLEEDMDKPGRYNSQFHPELARNRRRQTHYSGI